MPDTYTDILITDNDLTLDAGGIPEAATDRNVIAQDICHMIRETGLLVELVGNRNADSRATSIVNLQLAIEEDERIVPGTVQIEEPEPGRFYITADTEEFGPIYFDLQGK
ncbi:MAG: DUF2590 family protein [Desulfovibrio sp.]